FTETSPTIPCAPACARATCATRSGVRATNATRAPRPSSSRTRASPSPEVPPVTATRRPVKRSGESEGGKCPMEGLRVERPAPAVVFPHGGLLRDRPASIISQEHTLIIGRSRNMSSDNLENKIRPAADRFLVLLKTRGPQTAAELGKAAGVTAE